MKKALIPTTLFSLVLGACGSSGPDLDQVKKDFEKPSGATTDKQGLAGASAGQSGNSNNQALSLAGGGFLGFGLQSADRLRGLATLSPARLFEPRARELFALYTGRAYRPLRTEAAGVDGDCFDANAYREAVADAAGDKEFNFEYSIDDLSACDDSLSGSIELKVNAKLKDDNTSFEYKVEYKFNGVADSSNGNKIDGSMIMEMSAMTTGTSAGQFKYVTAWDFTMTEDGTTFSSRGGMRLGFSGNSQQGQASIEYLVYVNNGSEEVSYVLSYGVNNGQASWKIRGSDGEISCTWNENGGECSNGQSWTKEEYEAAEMRSRQG